MAFSELLGFGDGLSRVSGFWFVRAGGFALGDFVNKAGSHFSTH